MKKLFLFIAFIFIYLVTFSQENVTILKSNTEISFLLKQENGLYAENIIFQFENTSNKKSGITKEKYQGFKYLFDGQTMITFVNNEIRIYTISDNLTGDNVVKGYGLSKRVGKFKILEDALNNKVAENHNDVFSVVVSVPILNRNH
jgi:hypothetical protein